MIHRWANFFPSRDENENVNKIQRQQTLHVVLAGGAVCTDSMCRVQRVYISSTYVIDLFITTSCNSIYYLLILVLSTGSNETAIFSSDSDTLPNSTNR